MTKKGTVFFIFILLSISAWPQTTYFTGGNICKNQDWELVFSDEFNGSTLNHNNWINYFPYTAMGNDQCEFCRTHGDEGQVYLDSNVVVSNGTLKLIAKRQESTWFGASRSYTSGMIHSQYPFEYKYGKFEISCKIPFGMGFWPAFWLFSPTGTEIDIFEFGGQKPFHHHIGIGKWNGPKLEAGYDGSYDGVDYSLAFHVFTVEWDPFFISFKVDDKEMAKMCRFYTLSGTEVTGCCVNPGVYNVQPAWPSGENNRVNIIANLAIGNDVTPFTGPPDNNTVLPNQLEINYIRVYQRKPQTGLDEVCEVILFPNPVTESFTIIRSKNMNRVRVINPLGEEIFESTVNSNEVEISLNHVSKGIYFVIVESDDGIIAKKIIKQ